ncbi:hypothetical protein GQ600_21191 [Phytophthora cactorum]|nr:hypothetical protein GQ600_21191 [Phytophthora cactorum]
MFSIPPYIIGRNSVSYDLQSKVAELSAELYCWLQAASTSTTMAKKQKTQQEDEDLVMTIASDEELSKRRRVRTLRIQRMRPHAATTGAD